MSVFVDKLFEFGISVGYTFFFIGLVLIVIVFAVSDVEVGSILGFALATSPIWLPLTLFFLFFESWLNYVQQKFKMKQGGRVTLEIILPQEVFKSPEAMEIMLTQLYQKGSPDNYMETYLDGKHPPTFSLEIVSRGGSVHFYINSFRKKFKETIETQLYAQYPGIEVRELPVDYTAEVTWGDEWEVFGMHLGTKKDDVFPIKTYVDFGLQDNPKEEEKHDPLATLLDFFASLGPNEQFWMQILIKAHRDYTFKEGSLTFKDDWRPQIDKAIDKIYEDCRKRRGSADEEGEGRSVQLTDGEKNKIKALERSRSKIAFDTVIRAMYVAKKDHFNVGQWLGAFISVWFAFADNNMNSIGMKMRTDFDYNIWQDPSGKRRAAMKKTMLNHYKRRVYVPFDHNDQKSILTVEELATIFHVPGKVILTPNVSRIPSTRNEAPSNLPVG